MEISEFYSGIKASDPEQYINIFNRKGEMLKYIISKETGEHGGGDDKLRRMILAGDVPDPFGQQADSNAGALSCLIGIAANKSIAGNSSVKIKDLLI